MAARRPFTTPELESIKATVGTAAAQAESQGVPMEYNGLSSRYLAIGTIALSSKTMTGMCHQYGGFTQEGILDLGQLDEIGQTSGRHDVGFLVRWHESGLLIARSRLRTMAGGADYQYQIMGVRTPEEEDANLLLTEIEGRVQRGVSEGGLDQILSERSVPSYLRSVKDLEPITTDWVGQSIADNKPQN